MLENKTHSGTKANGGNTYWRYFNGLRIYRRRSLAMKMEPRSQFWTFTFMVLSVFTSALAANNYYCDEPLVAPLPQSSFESSSKSSNSHSPYLAKLNSRDGGGGWAPRRADRHPWLQVDLRDRVEVTAVATQGRHGSLDWTTGYVLLFSDTGRSWKQYRQEDGVWMFQGNTDAEGVVHYKFPQAIRTRFLRFVPQDWNPQGWMGLRVEAYGCAYKSDVADFDGRSSLLYRFNQKSMSTVKDVISLKFKSQQGEGVLVHGEGQWGDYITLELHRGRLALHLNLDDAKLRSGSGQVSVTLGSLLDDQHWHSVLIERFGKLVNFTVDKHMQHFRTQGEGDSLEVDYELSFGGIPLPGKPGTFLRKNFRGCIENLYYNGVNIIDLAKRRKPQIYSVGNVTFACSETQLVAATFLSSSGSFLLLPAEPAAEGVAVRFQFRTWNADGLLLSLPLAQGSAHLLLHLSGGQLCLTHRHSALGQSEILTGHMMHDGLWHSVNLTARGLLVNLTLDIGLAWVLQLDHHFAAGSALFFGGCPGVPAEPGCKNPTSAFQGCMRQIFINDQLVDLFRVQAGLLGNYSELQIDVCGIWDRCLPNFCEHGGQCSQSWTAFYCNCSGTGYSGATCHNSVYEPSCEAYRQTGSSSGYFSIDPDGSGPLGPMLVYCNMTGDRVWTVVPHNSTEAVRVKGSTLQRPYIMSFNYNASPEQLRTLVTGSEQCQQEVVYQCRKSRLFNTKVGTPLSWWMDRNGERRTYWGGFLPGVQQCSCSLDGNCIDMNYFCNCDANRDSWANDTGLLSYKDHLPMSEIAIGDTNRTGAEAVYKIGPLRCYGDRFFWNAASFYLASSYLHFPTFQAELSAGISFYFKTTTPSGVFLENLGVKDFIRVELSTPLSVAFTFDVGNGPAVLLVRSHLPLNDKQWHYVRAERNVKEASLQVDQLPLRFLEAPPNGHFRLQLNGQLFVGGTLSRQSGFLGCIRALKLNGRTLDLEERARTAPGVSPGCPGHCSSDSLCQNGGRCVEKRGGYACDCTHSAYGGPHCMKEVSASFERGSSITYTFREPVSFLRNDSGPSSGARGDGRKSRANVAFSFLTTQAPAMLLTASAHPQQYMAVTLAHNGSLQIWYHLGKESTPEVFIPQSTSLADGQLHRVQIHREGKDVYVQIDTDISQKYKLMSEWNTLKSLTLGKVTGSEGMDEEVVLAGSRGFVGCLSAVQFNQAAPLKVALRNRGSSLVNVQGHVTESNCGASTSVSTFTTSYSLSDHSENINRGKEPLKNANQSDSVVIGGVIAAVVFITLCVLAVMTRYLYQHRQSSQAGPGKEKDHRHSLDLSRRTEMDLQSSARDRKEYFI
ncbi:contactin-associated protein-like 5 isoform X1 [Anguilla anguilla]|uniref:contactin-associated protein-like 5 isoform X1 n=1 Tax=Anguilla anguilla TaxID=7936 RepID=UPI0015AFAC0F|nr:contactin-associated protein-like 5 isoform X1 [Anguilla anguilla]